jgi:DNA segregation ATPase FtsK/SpoIIIE-like protein
MTTVIHEAKPYIVIIIDELADLMMTSGRELKSRSRVLPKWLVP